MKRILAGALAGAIVFFMWGFLAWPVLHLYDFAFPTTPRESAIRSVLDDSLSHNGAFFIPGFPEESADMTPQQRESGMEEWRARHREGPIALVIFRRAGAEPEDPLIILRGFGVEFLAALLLALLLSCTRIPTFGGRLCFVFFAALFAVLTTHGVQWNFFNFPTEYSFALMLDPLVGWLLAGVPMALIVRSPQAPAA